MRPKPDDLTTLRHTVADLLDEVLVRRENGFTVQEKLRALEQELAGASDEEVPTLLARAQGTVGMVNVSPPGDPLHDKAIADLIALKQELRRAAAPRRE